jgi:glutathione-regulated potassium-efflux system protein KefB
VLTSTAIVFQMLQERGQMGQPAGRRMISILLLEDLAIVPLLILVAFLAPGGEETTTSDRVTAIATGFAALGAVVVAGRYLLDPMFRLIARFGVREVMTAAALLVVLGAAVLMDAAGLSMAMGAFLAGVLLSESSFRHQLEADIEPFRGLLLGLFFLGVGMALDLNVIAANWTVVAISVPAFMALKMGVIYGVARFMKADRAEALQRMVLMAQGGEFAFVLYGAATQAGILTPEWNANLTAIIIISMVLTPLMVLIHDRYAPKAQPSMDGVEEARDLAGCVLLIGFGRFGQIVSQPLLARGHTVSIIDVDPGRIREAERFGFKVFYGDGSRLDILRAAGAAQASVIVVAASDRDAISRIVELAHHEFPMVPVLARATTRQHAQELLRHGAAFQIRETYESAMVMGREALLHLAEPPEVVEDVMADVRARDAERMALEQIGGVDASRALIRGNMAQVQGGH